MKCTELVAFNVETKHVNMVDTRFGQDLGERATRDGDETPECLRRLLMPTATRIARRHAQMRAARSTAVSYGEWNAPTWPIVDACRNEAARPFSADGFVKVGDGFDAQSRPLEALFEHIGVRSYDRMIRRKIHKDPRSVEPPRMVQPDPPILLAPTQEDGVSACIVSDAVQEFIRVHIQRICCESEGQ